MVVSILNFRYRKYYATSEGRLEMSTRSYQRLAGDSEVLRISSRSGERKVRRKPHNDSSADGEPHEGGPFSHEGLMVRKQMAHSVNTFGMGMFTTGFGALVHDEASGQEDSEEDCTVNEMAKKGTNKRKKKKKKKNHKSTGTSSTVDDDIDAVVREVNQQFGAASLQTANTPASTTKHVLCVERRNLNPETELRRIFGSKIVHSGKRRTHSRAHLRVSSVVQPKETWPRLDKLGLTMELVESKNNVHDFLFKHSLPYQEVQFAFLDAVASLDHNNIAAVLNLYPYHIDSLLQLSEVCRMTEDYQMSADLIERALYSFECNFHSMFNYTQANCRLDYKYQENRSLFLVLYKHIINLSNRGCHRTALEFCKFLLGLSPDDDPLCALLMIDFYAIRAEDYAFLRQLYLEWESSRNLSQLPNFALTVPLATFHEGRQTQQPQLLAEADEKLQTALCMYPMVLLPLLNKCSVVMDDEIVGSPLFTASTTRVPEALQLLIQLYVERNYMLWKIPEVLTWLETNARAVAQKYKATDTTFVEHTQRSESLYQGTPRNVYRHIIVSEYPTVVAMLPKSVTGSPILAFDPLPPKNSVAGYSRPKPMQPQIVEESFVQLFLRSFLPSYNPETDVGEADMQGAAAQALGETTQYLRQTLADLLERLAPAVEVQETGPGAVQHGQGMEQEGEENFSDTSLD